MKIYRFNDYCYDTEDEEPRLCTVVQLAVDMFDFNLHFVSFVASLLTFLVVSFMPGFNHIQVS